MGRPKKKGGRVMPSGRDEGRPRVGGSQPGKRAAGGRAEGPVSSARYTPPDRDVVVRPRWHRVAGWVGVAAGVAVVVVNDAMLAGIDTELLPFGHSELYLILGLLIAGLFSRFLGLFDRQTIFQ